MTHPVNAELVAVHWIKAVADIPTDQVNTTVPGMSDEFAANGFVQAQIIGGTPNMYSGMRNSIVQVDAYAYNKNSNKPPWGKSRTLLSHIEKEIEAETTARMVETPDAFENAYVHEVRVAQEARRVPGDESMARYQMDLIIHWSRRT